MKKIIILDVFKYLSGGAFSKRIYPKSFGGIKKKKKEQAGAELWQAQVKVSRPASPTIKNQFEVVFHLQKKFSSSSI